jgi:riboflavin synthase
MFTGIIQAVGQIAAVAARADDMRLTVVSETFDISDVNPGDSIAINGVCLTVVELQSKGFEADVSAETLSCTTFSDLAAGDSVNLEKALLPTTRLGGHLVSGHVDGIATVTGCRDVGQSRRIDFSVPAVLSRYIAVKGSVCIDGVSLTVNEVKGHSFSVNIIPHTQQQTISNQYQSGSRANIEVDIIARYLERLLGVGSDGSVIDLALLQRTGFSGSAEDH